MRFSDKQSSSSEPNYPRLLIASLLTWASSFIAARYIVSRDIVDSTATGILVSLAPSIIAAISAFVYFKYIKQCDEMQRSIQITALATSIGVGAVLWPALTLMNDLFHPSKPLGEFLPAIMAFGYMLAVLFSTRKLQ